MFALFYGECRLFSSPALTEKRRSYPSGFTKISAALDHSMKELKALPRNLCEVGEPCLVSTGKSLQLSKSAASIIVRHSWQGQLICYAVCALFRQTHGMCQRYSFKNSPTVLRTTNDLQISFGINISSKYTQLGGCHFYLKQAKNKRGCFLFFFGLITITLQFLIKMQIRILTATLILDTWSFSL